MKTTTYSKFIDWRFENAGSNTVEMSANNATIEMKGGR